MKIRISTRAVAGFVVAVGLLSSGVVSSPASASAVEEGSSSVALGATWIYREHPTANHERVDLFEDRIDKVKDQHNINFSALVRAIEWARSPRCFTSQDGNDRGVYR